MEEYQALCAPVIRAGAAFIFLLGKTHTSDNSETIFIDHAGCSRVSHYFILVLVSGRDERARNQVQDKIEHGAVNYSITALVLDLVQFNNWLEEGHFFAVMVLEKAQLLYDSGKDRISTGGIINEEKRKCEQKQVYQRSRVTIEEFMAGAELFQLRGQYRLAAFMLHQSAEQTLRALLIMQTGLHIVTHNIEKLLRYCLLVCPQLEKVFCRHDEEDRRLLQLLQKAYIDARYRADYCISAPEAKTLTGKLRALQEIFEKSV